MPVRTVVLLLAFASLAIWFGAMALLASVTRPNKSVAVEGEQFVTIDGGTIRYQMAGDGERVLLLLHGFNSNLSMWDRHWAQLEPCPVRRLRLDIPGFGASQFETDNYRIEAQADRINAFLEALEIDKATVVGGSMGGSLAVSLAARHPERVEQLLLLAPSGYPGALQHTGVFGLVTKPGVVRRAANWMAGTPVYKTIFPGSVALHATSVSASYGEDWLQQLKNVRAPAFVAWSKGDRIAHADTAQKVVDALPDGTLYWLDESAGHRLPMTEPAFVSEIACLMGQGVNAHDIAGRLSPSAEVAAEGNNTPSNSGSVE